MRHGVEHWLFDELRGGSDDDGRVHEVLHPVGTPLRVEAQVPVDPADQTGVYALEITSYKWD